ncbi:hypothetical protein KY331_03415 [Candidatus Woesearchaeota archaeon]|nr:hypothetical protein [Candidatus Woesearchaeota archaeon]
MVPLIKVVDGEATSEALMNIANHIAFYTSEEVKKRAREGTLGKALGRKGETGDRMKSGDEIADEVIADILPGYLEQGIGPAFVYSEEKGVYVLGEGGRGFFVIVDPLDGSNNLRKGVLYPFISISVALGNMSDVHGNDTFSAIRVGVVRDIFNHRTYSATRDTGFAYVDDALEPDFRELRTYDEDPSRIRVETATELEEAVLGVDLDKDKDENPEEMKERLDKLSELMKDKLCQRRLGSSILDFCKVAAGEYDAFISIGGRMKLHDLAAAKLIVEEAGGIFDVSGGYPGNLVEHIFKNDPADANKALKESRYKVIAAANPVIYGKIKGCVEF